MTAPAKGPASYFPPSRRSTAGRSRNGRTSSAPRPWPSTWSLSPGSRPNTGSATDTRTRSSRTRLRRAAAS